MRRIALAACFALLLIAPVQARAAQPPIFGACQPQVDAADSVSYRVCHAPTASFDGTQLDTDLTLPAGTTPNGGYPLLVMMHGWGGSRSAIRCRAAAGRLPPATSCASRSRKTTDPT